MELFLVCLIGCPRHNERMAERNRQKCWNMSEIRMKWMEVREIQYFLYAAFFPLNRWEKSNRCIHEPLQEYFYSLHLYMYIRFVCRTKGTAAEREKEKKFISRIDIFRLFSIEKEKAKKRSWIAVSSLKYQRLQSIRLIPFDQIFTARTLANTILSRIHIKWLFVSRLRSCTDLSFFRCV